MLGNSILFGKDLVYFSVFEVTVEKFDLNGKNKKKLNSAVSSTMGLFPVCLDLFPLSYILHFVKAFVKHQQPL